MASTTSKELSFSVPWGAIQAKCWGPPSGKPFLGLHGWLDNANTFDKLAPLLPKNIYFVAIDFPGHGQSSCRPVGVPNNFFDWVIDVKWVVSQLGWKRFSLIGHSMGAGVASAYAGTFPNEVETAILIENRRENVTPEDAPDILANAAKFLTSNSGRNEKNYKVFQNVEAAVARLMKASPDHTQESAETLIRRRIINAQNPQKDEEIHIKSDARLRSTGTDNYKGGVYVTTIGMAEAVCKQISCNVMNIYGIDCHPHFIGSSLLKKRFDDVLKKNAKYFELVDVPGNHFVHLHDPALIAQRIDSFLKKCNLKSKL